MRLASNVLLAAAFAASMLGCGNSGPQAVTPVLAASEPASASPRPAATPVQDSAFVASGPLLVEKQVDLAAQRAGVVTKILVDVGRQVRQGQLLAALDDRQLLAQRDAAQAATRSAQANLQDWQAETRMAQADFRRADAMFKAQLNTQEELDHARYKWQGSEFEVEKGKQDLLHAQAALQAASLELEKAYFRAPFDGIVARRYVRLGQELAPGDRVFWITTVRPLQVKFTVPERLIGRIRSGQVLEITCGDEPGVKHAAKVLQVSPVVDPSSGTFEVLAQVVNPGRDLRPGMTVDVRFGGMK